MCQPGVAFASVRQTAFVCVCAAFGDVALLVASCSLLSHTYGPSARRYISECPTDRQCVCGGGECWVVGGVKAVIVAVAVCVQFIVCHTSYCH